jgi:EmrB/QacA subfamily drug resistance transporter
MPPTEVEARVDAARAGTTGQAHPVQLPHRWWALAVIGFAQLMVVLDATIVSIALPSAQKALHFNNDGRQWIVTAYSLAFGSLLLLGGRLADIVGRKTTFVLGAIGFASASALGGVAGSFTMLVVARAIQGACGALLAPAALSLLTTTFTEPKERARAFGIFGAIAGSGAAIGLMLGGVLTQYLNWRWTLYVNVILAVFALAGAVVFLPRSGPARRPRLDVPGVMLVSGALFCVVFGFANAETHPWGNWMTWGFLAVGAVLLLAFFLWQSRAAHPLLPLRVLADRNRGAALSAVLIASAGMFGVFLFLTYYLQGTQGYSPIENGLAFLPMVGALMVVAQLSTNWLVPRIGSKVIVPIGMLLAAGGMVWLTRLGLHSAYPAHVLPPLLLIGTGIGLSMPAAMSQATLGVQMSDQGVASATANTTQQVGGSISTALLNTLAASAATSYAAHHLTDPLVVADSALHSYATTYWWAAGFFAFGALVTVLLFRRHRASLPAGANAATAEGLTAPAIAPAAVLVPAGTTSVALGSTAAVRGRVLDGTGVPVPHAVIALLDPAGRQLDRATSGEDGGYAVVGPARGSVVLIGSATGHQPKADALAVGGAPISHDLVLFADLGDLVGTVRGADSDAVSGALVVATDGRGSVASSTTTDVQGGYRMDGLMPGAYTVTVSAPGHRPAAEPAIVSAAGSRCDIELRPVVSVQGTVRSRDGRPLTSSRVTLLDAAGDVVAARSTGADGSYCFAGLSGETYTVVASGYSPVATPVAPNGSSHEVIDLFLGDEEADGRDGDTCHATSVIPQVG